MHPLQQIANSPLALSRRASDFFVTQNQLAGENDRLKQQQLMAAVQVQRNQSLAGGKYLSATLARQPGKIRRQRDRCRNHERRTRPVQPQNHRGQGQQRPYPAGPGGDRRYRAGGPGHPGAGVKQRNHPDYRQGPGRAGGSGAQRPARHRLRPWSGQHAGTGFHGHQYGHPERRQAGDFRHRRHLPARRAGCCRDPDRAQCRLSLRQDHLHAERRRRSLSQPAGRVRHGTGRNQRRNRHRARKSK